MKHLLAISIGPVQEFIAAGRRTNDLYAGSTMLVEISKAAASAIHTDGSLIFPAAHDSDGPNKLLIELNEGVNPSDVAGRARTDANKYLSDQWLLHAGPYMNYIDAGLARDQIDGFLEYYAAWVPLLNDDDYAQARCNLDRLLAGRKALRDFSAPISRSGSAKSPLDPARDGVLLADTPAEVRRFMKLKRTESPDAISLMKRIMGSGAGRPPSTSMLASRAVPNLLPDEIITELERLAERCDLGSDYSDLLYPERTSEKELGPDRFAALTELRKRAVCAAGLGKDGSFPAYYAILQADGDRMGKLLGSLTTADEHRAFSCALAGFAQTARSTVQAYNGHLVYAGGDDVLALLPLNGAISCADRLRREFRAALRSYRKEEVDGTLSVGVAIVHHLDSLQTSLDHARSAEQFAKQAGDRNSLALALHTRGGSPITVCYKWTEDPDPESHVLGCAAGFRDQKHGLSRGFPYELASLAREWRGSGLPAKRLQAEADRLLTKKTKSGAPGLIPEAIAKCDSADALLRLANSLVIARLLANYPAPAVHP